MSLVDHLVNEWWLCPNTPSCPHGAALHDIQDYDDPMPRCCIEGCTCGAGVEIGETP